VEAAVLGALFDIPWGTVAGIYGVVFVLLPGPQQSYFWLKDRHCIEVDTQLGIYSFYKRDVLYWKWSNVRDDGHLSDDCKALMNRTETPASGDTPR
jgi:hypothetical protein